jgi:retron-type reverse transcriptase
MLNKLKSCKNIYDLSDILGIPASSLSFLIYKLPPQKRYISFCISKKNGKMRTISAPEERLKSLQKNLANILYECQAEIEQKRGRGASYGFCRGRSIFENAKVHQRKTWVFNTDILDFFPSINFGRVRGYFIRNNDFQLDPRAATVLAQIACWNNALPQGAPTSPIISNMICGSIDYRLSRLASRNKCSYSRYADDLTFSTNMAEFPEEIACTFNDPQGWCAGDVLIDIIKQSGFSLNPTKSRMSFKESRQSVTGLVANAFPNTPREDRKLIRASVHRLMSGHPLEIKKFCKNFSQNCPKEEPRNEPRSEPPTDALRILEGKAGYMHWIHNKSDKRDDKKVLSTHFSS